jgi:hypothetical protein
MRVGPACNVTGRPNCWRARFETSNHDNATIDDKPCHLCKFGPWAQTDTDDHKIGLKSAAALSVTRLPVDGARCVLKVERTKSRERTKSSICAPIALGGGIGIAPATMVDGDDVEIGRQVAVAWCGDVSFAPFSLKPDRRLSAKAALMVSIQSDESALPSFSTMP